MSEDLIDLSNLDDDELTSSGIPVKELRNAGAIEFGIELLEGLYEIIEISEDQEKETISRVAFMVEAVLERDYNCVIEKEDKFDIRSLDS